MLQLVNVGQKSLADYATIATRGLMDEIRRLAEPLAGRRLLHLSATAFGGGVAEINYALVPLMKDAGLDVEWRVITGGDEFFATRLLFGDGQKSDLVSRSLRVNCNPALAEPEFRVVPKRPTGAKKAIP